MNREFLEEIGIEKEQVDKIMKEHGKAIQSVKNEDEEAKTTIDTLEKQLEERNSDLKKLREAAEGNEDLEEQLQSMNEKYETEKSDLESRLAKQQKQAEIRLGITKAGAKNEKAVMALLDAESVKINDEGVQGLKDQIESLKESDPYLFKSENEPSGQAATGGNRGGGGRRGTKKSAFEIAAERHTKK